LLALKIKQLEHGYREADVEQTREKKKVEISGVPLKGR
jgi:hypothetical protein